MALHAERRLVVGTFARGLFEAFRHEIAAWTRADPLAPGVVLVGSNLLALWLARRLALEGAPHVGLRFCTFVDLARALAEPRVAHLAPLPPGGRALLAQTLVRDDRDRAGFGVDTGELRDDYFASVSERPGFRHRLAATFGDLDDGGFADSAERLAGAWPADDAKLRSVLRFYAAYRSSITGRFITTSDCIRAAAHAASRFGEAFGTRRLALYGFYDFTEVQRSLLAALAAPANALHLAVFAPDPDLPGHAFAREGVAFFEGLGLGRESVAPHAPDDTPRPALEIISAPGEVEESREIARLILRLARDEGIAFREIAVLLRNPASHSALLREALGAAGIPFFLHQGLPLSATAAGRGFELLFALAGTDFDRQDVIDFLTAAPLAPERIPLSGFSPSLWNLVTKRAGIVSGRSEWIHRLARVQNPNVPSAERTAAATLLALVTPLMDDIAALPRSASWSRIAREFVRVLESWIAPSPERDEITAILEGLAANDRLVGDTSLEEFRSAARDAISSATQKIGRFGIDSVTVTDMKRARGLVFRAVFVPGVVERAFPAPPSQDPILLDRDRAELRATGAGRLADGRARAREEEILFAIAMASATERVVLSYARFESGTTRERTPSPFILRAAEAHAGRRLDFATLPEAPGFRRIPLLGAGLLDPDRALTAAERRVAVALGAPGTMRDALVARVASAHTGFARAVAQWDARWRSGSLNAHTGRLSVHATRRLRAAHPLLAEALSPSAMETYATCPYRYFLKNAVGLQRIPEPEKLEEIEAADRGSLVHTILERLFETLHRERLLPLDSERLDRARALAASVSRVAYREAEERGLTGYPLLWELKRGRIDASIDALLVWEAERTSDAIESAEGGAPPDHAVFRDVLLEREFGDGGLAEASVTLSRAKTIRFRGKIDRIDLSADRARFLITDYKVREASAPPKPRGVDPVFRGGEALQLPVYLLAAKTLIGGDAPPSATGDARYLYLIQATAKIKEDLLADALFASRAADFDAILRTIASGIESGFFPVYPAGGENCRSCEYAEVCGPARTVTRLYDGKADDERFEAFHAMKALGSVGGGADDGGDDAARSEDDA
ncbi:MAG: PD-(D/E)XK nuclease family protein [bacterium]